MEAIIGAAAGLGGAVIGALLTVWLTAREERRRGRVALTLQLYSEFNGEELLRARRRAVDLVNARNLSQTLPAHIGDLEGQLEPDDLHALTMVLLFFEKLELLRANGHLDMALAQQLFTPHFSRWYDRLEAVIVGRGADLPRWTTVLASWHRLRQAMYQNRIG